MCIYQHKTKQNKTKHGAHHQTCMITEDNKFKQETTTENA